MNVRKCNEYIPIVPLYGNIFNQVIFSLVFCLVFLITSVPLKLGQIKN